MLVGTPGGKGGGPGGRLGGIGMAAGMVVAEVMRVGVSADVLLGVATLGVLGARDKTLFSTDDADEVSNADMSGPAAEVETVEDARTIGIC